MADVETASRAYRDRFSFGYRQILPDRLRRYSMLWPVGFLRTGEGSLATHGPGSRNVESFEILAVSGQVLLGEAESVSCQS